jgi:hypothetical protein
VRDALRRDRALRALVGAARVVFDPELAALERCGGGGVERLARGPRRDRGEAQALRGLPEIEPLMARELIEPRLEQPKMLEQHAAAGVLKQPLHDRERLELVRRKPQARQLEGFARVGLAVFVAA